MSKAVILLLSLTFSLNTLADNHMVIMGGGAEPLNQPTTIFDKEMRNLGSFLNKNKGWETKISFNGGHAETEKIIDQGIAKVAGKNSTFSEAAYEKLIDEYEKKIKNGEIKSGDQLIVYISTHGAQKTDKEKTHKIATSGAASEDLTTLSNASLVSMDRLQNLVSLAEKKGVKLALLDFSCHSGATLALKNPNTCIITASGPNHFGYASWGARFADNMEKGKNLEEIFLKTFGNRYETAFPMISTPVGIDIQNELYELMSPYLYYWEEKNDKLTPFLEKQVANNQCEEANLKFDQLVNLLKQTDEVLKKAKIRSNTKGLVNALKDYHELQNNLRNELKKMGLANIDKKEKYCSEVQAGSMKFKSCSEWSTREILMMDYDKVIGNYKKMQANGEDSEFIQASIENLEKAKARRDQLLASNPEYKKYMDYYKKLPDFHNKSWSMALAVSSELQKIYSELYEAKSKEDKRPNPCKDFVL